jgi:hypothetical protein
MTALAQSMLVLFMAAWFVAVGAWFYSARYFMPMWSAGFQKRDQHNGYVKKALKGVAVFLLAGAIGFGAGLIAEYWGGGW